MTPGVVILVFIAGTLFGAFILSACMQVAMRKRWCRRRIFASWRREFPEDYSAAWLRGEP